MFWASSHILKTDIFHFKHLSYGVSMCFLYYLHKPGLANATCLNGINMLSTTIKNTSQHQNISLSEQKNLTFLELKLNSFNHDLSEWRSSNSLFKLSSNILGQHEVMSS